MVYTDKDYNRAANITVIVAGIAVLIRIFFKYTLEAILPFLLAALLTSLLSPPAKKLAKKSKLPEKAVTAALVILFFLVIALLIRLAATRLLNELGKLIDRLSQDPESISRILSDLGERMNQSHKRFGFLEGVWKADFFQRLGIDPQQLLSDAMRSLLTSLTSSLSAMAMSAVSALPSILLFAAVFLISVFYFCVDGDRIGTYCRSLLPERWQQKLPLLKAKLTRTLSGYLKAYLLLMLLTFAEVLVGLTLLRVEYALLLSLVIATVDILPILGAGTVLLPWSLMSFATGDSKLGTGLLILYGAVLIVRQIAEPKIVGNSIGLHPLATLASVYLGIRFLGIGGIFIGPIVALLLKNLLGGEEAATLSDPPIHR